MNHFKAALTSGLAVSQAAQGAQNVLSMAGQRPPVFKHRRDCARQGSPPAFHGLRVTCSNPPNAIKVGASSDREQC